MYVPPPHVPERERLVHRSLVLTEGSRDPLREVQPLSEAAAPGWLELVEYARAVVDQPGVGERFDRPARTPATQASEQLRRLIRCREHGRKTGGQVGLRYQAEANGLTARD